MINYQFSSKIGGPLNDRTFNPVWLAPPEIQSKDKKGIDLSKLNKETPMQTLLKSVTIPKWETVFSEKFKDILVSLNKRQQLKKLNIKADMSGDDPWHNFEEDLLVTILGSELEDHIEELEFDIVELEKKEVEGDDIEQKNNESQDKEEKEVEGNDRSKQEIEGEVNEFSQDFDADEILGGVKIVKKIYEVADFYIKDPEFVLRILSGEIAPGLNSIHEYPMTIPEDDNDFGYIKLI